MDTNPAIVRCSQDGPDTVKMFGMTINNVELEEVFQAVSQQIRKKEPGYILTPNVDHICMFQDSEKFREAYHKAFLVLPDSTPIMWASKLLGRPLKRKLSGSDLIFWLTEYAAEKGHSIFLFGADEGIAEKAAEILKEKYPALEVAGTYCPPFGFEKDPALLAASIRAIQDTKPDICYVALGSPKQDLFCLYHHHETGALVHIEVGISLSFVTGDVKRAPVWMQYGGLEWLWRIFQEPRRLIKRYLVRDMKFLPLVWREFRQRKKD